jgi:hypothetical protein
LPEENGKKKVLNYNGLVPASTIPEGNYRGKSPN